MIVLLTLVRYRHEQIFISICRVT